MKKITISIFLGLLLISGLTLAKAAVINGSGATFPAPLYQRWAAEFHRNQPAVTVNYQGVGSGAGVADFTRGLTDFCASDVALQDKEIERLHGNAVMIPVTAGMIVLAYNIPGVTTLKLSREAYLGIILGKITQWNDPIIAASNAGTLLPSLPITMVARSDGSGTTALFTEHLVAISSDFDRKVGSGKSVKWPVGLAGKGNDGVTSLIKGTAGAIGYVEYGFAKNNALPMATLENKMGAFVVPSDEAGTMALAGIVMPDNLRGFAPDPAGAGDYPISGFTWIVVKKEYPLEKSAALKAFLTYALTTGQSLASPLGYLPLPKAVIEKSQQALAGVK